MIQEWEQILADSITRPEDLPPSLINAPQKMSTLCQRFPLGINRYFLDLVLRAGGGIARQVVPAPRELKDEEGLEDSLAEERDSPVKNITHRYPDRVLFLVSNRCAVYCRFCTRRRRVGRGGPVSDETIERGIEYIRSQKQVRDVLLSGGDPLLLNDERLDSILAKIKRIPHVEMIRIGSRVPSALPQRITDSLVRVLKKYHPLYINVHFNHPAECTAEAVRACARLADAGLPLASQTVLLRGINDTPQVLAALFRKLLTMRVRPYYLLQCDLVKGTEHFRTHPEVGKMIMRELRGDVSGMALPTFVIDLPGGGGKVPLTHDYIIDQKPPETVVENYQGDSYRYPHPAHKKKKKNRFYR